MKIAEIRIYQVELPLLEGRYSWSDGNYVEMFDRAAALFGERLAEARR